MYCTVLYMATTAWQLTRKYGKDVQLGKKERLSAPTQGDWARGCCAIKPIRIPDHIPLRSLSPPS